MSKVNAPEIIEHLNEYSSRVEHTVCLILDSNDKVGLNFELSSFAKKIELFHQIKKRNLGNELSELGEPVWKIMLRLFINANTDQNMTVADISQKISFPETTVLRYIKILDDNGYIKWLSASEQRNGGLQLTQHGQTIMTNTLLALSAF